MAAVFTLNGVSAGLVSLSYDALIGITPQVMRAVIAPGDLTGPPPVLCTVTFGVDDGLVLTLPKCRLANFREEQGGDGRNWILSIQDRRWMWERGFCWVEGGDFNQLDDRGKFVPWTLRSPHQLAVMCLTRMGEVPPPGGWNFTGVLPGGLAVPANGAANPPIPPPGPQDVLVNPGDDYLKLGQNLPASGTNPPTVWLALPAAAALAQLCDRYGATVVWNPADDRVTLQRLGVGLPLPTNWPLASGGVSLDPLVLPSKVTVVGAPVRFQPRLAFRPVGKDWDLGYYPLDELTYAPTNGVAGNKWYRSGPPSFGAVMPTARLNYYQAKQLAQESVYRDYQLVCVNPADKNDPTIPIPGLNRFVGVGNQPDGVARVTNRFQIILQDTRPEQVEPRPGDENRVDPVTKQPFAQDVYNGYSKDRLPVSFGSIHNGVGGVRAFGIWGVNAALGPGNQTPPRSRFFVPFGIADPLRQVIRYAAAVYSFPLVDPAGPVTGPRYSRGPGDPDNPLVVETGVLVLHPYNFAPVRFVYDLELGGPGPAVTVYRDDVTCEVVSQYDEFHVPTGATVVDADARARADYYARAVAYAYQAVNATTVQAVGFFVPRLSGVVRQIGWSLSPAGYDTTASANSERAPNTVPFPARRRAENLPADPVVAVQNLSTYNGPLAPNAARRQER